MTSLTVWSVRWDNDHETGCNVYSTKDDATAFYRNTAEEWWADHFPDEDMPDDTAEAVDQITGVADLNELVLESHVIPIPTPVRAIVAGLLEPARAHVEDWESGLKDGTYDSAAGLAEAMAAVRDAEQLLAGK